MDVFHLLVGVNGRIGRLAYWLGTLGVWAMTGVALWLATQLADIRAQSLLSIPHATVGSANVPAAQVVFVIGLLSLVFFGWAGLALCVKRWHDRGKSGWWVLIGLIPVIGQLWTLAECGLLPGTPGENRFGGR
ncbi:MAG: DUF805 domain-containing protein [Gemmatimonadales bacterium]